MQEDLCPASQKKRDDQWPDLVKARHEGKLAYFKYTKLVTRKRPELTDGSPLQQSETMPPSENPEAPDTSNERQFPPPGHDRRSREGARGGASSAQQGRASRSGSRSDEDAARDASGDHQPPSSPASTQRDTRSSTQRGRGGNARGRK